MLSGLTFFLFAGVLVFSALMVICARNPVHSVLFLILGFFNAAGLFVMLGAEFIAMILVIVYVGAVAVLFLFVVMMLDISFADLRRGAMQYVPLGLLVGAVLMLEITTMALSWETLPRAANVAPAGVVEAAAESEQPRPPSAVAETAVTNTEALGRILYTDYLFAFQVSGLILLVSMIGAIVLTLRVRPDVRRQKVARQFARTREDSVEIRKVTANTGI